MGTDDNREIEDQLNVLFDDLFDENEGEKKPEAAEEAAEAVKAAAEEAAAPVAEAAESAETAAEEAAIPAAEAVQEEVQEAAAATEGVVDDSGLENEARSLDFSDLDPELFEDEDEEAVFEEEAAAENKAPEDIFEAEEEDIIPVKDKTGKLPAFEEEDEDVPEQEADEEEADAYDVRAQRRKERSSQPTAEQLKKEYRHFWIFTAIVAFVVAVAVLGILYYRGIIGFGNKESAAPETSSTVPAPESTTKESETETTAPTTEPTTTESESETETESESETETESTSEEESTEPSTEDPRREVLDNYENVFIADANTLNIRQEASTSSAVIGTMKKNDAGSILEMNGDWAHIKSGGVDGYVAAEFIKTGEEAEKYAVENAREAVRIEADTLNVRSGASTDTQIVGRAKKGQIYDLIDQDSEGFYHIRFEDKEAFVSSEFCTLSWFLNEAKPE